jgi:PAS domain S-box-containing protein
MSSPTMNQVSMSRLLTRSLAITMTLVMVLIATGFYMLASAELERNFARKVEQTLSYLNGALGPVMWNFDIDTAVRIAETVVRDDLVVGITIWDEKRKVVFSANDQSDGSDVVETHSIRFKNKVVGHVELTFSQIYLVNTLENILWGSLLVWLLAVLAITVFTSLFIRKYFRGPLASFIDLAKSYRQNLESPPLNTTSFIEFQPIEEVVKDLANDVFRKLIELGKSEAYYRSIFENALYGIAVTGKDFQFTKVNEAWCKLIGYSENELLNNMGIKDVTLPGNMTKTKEMMGKLISGEIKEGHLEKRYKSKSGKIIDALTFVKGIYDETEAILEMPPPFWTSRISSGESWPSKRARQSTGVFLNP